MNSSYAYESRQVREEGKEAINRIREAFTGLTDEIDNAIMGLEFNGRRMALVRTKLEEAAMWAVKAITHVE